VKELVAVERVSRAELADLQLARLQKLVTRAAARVPLYRERLRRAGSPGPSSDYIRSNCIIIACLCQPILSVPA